MYSEETLNHPFSRITHTPNPSEAAIVRFIRNAYLAVGTASILAVLLGLLTLFVPRSAIAEWPFFGGVRAAEADVGFLHDPKLALLQAAVNPDPNPSKGSQLLALSGGSALIPASGVEGTIAEPGSSGTGSISVYTVRQGDSLSEVAEMFGVSVNTILWANDIRDPKTVTPGTTLVILPVSGIQHKVKSGQTLASIARTYDADAGDIAAYNGLALGSDILAGTEIIVPGGRIAAEPKAPAKKTTSSAKAPAAAKTTTASLGNWGNPLPGGRVSQGIHGYNGIDISAPSGTPIYAAAGGSIVVAKGGGGYNGGYGNYIVIDHGNGTQTLYAHMSGLAVSGGPVSKGSLIGYVGNTGRSTGYHLHFEVRGAKNPLAR